MQIQPLFWELFSLHTSHLAELSQSTKSPAVPTWALGSPAAACPCLHLPMYSQCLFSTATQDPSCPPSGSHLHDFPFGCAGTPALCWLFRHHCAYHPSSLTRNVQALSFSISIAETSSLHLSMDVKMPNSFLVVPLSSTKIFLLSYSNQFLLAPLCGNISS